MTKNIYAVDETEVTARNVIDLVVEHLGDRKFLDTLIENGNDHPRDINHANQEINRSHSRLQLKLDQYVDQRIMKKLAECRLISILPVD